MSDISNLIFGGKKSKKQRNKEKMAYIRAKGKAAEDQFAVSQTLQGKKVERIKKGADFRVTTPHPLTGKVIKTEIVEVKSGRSKLSKLQKKTKKKKSNYKVAHVEPIFF